MSRRNFDCVQPMGLVSTVFALLALVITAGRRYRPMQPSEVRNGGMRGIRSRPAVRKQGSRRPHARREIIKAALNVGRKSEIPSKMRAKTPGT